MPGTDFAGPGKVAGFAHGLLPPAAAAQLQAAQRRPRESFGDLQRQSLSVPLAKRRGTTLLCAMRPWPPPVLAASRR